MSANNIAVFSKRSTHFSKQPLREPLPLPPPQLSPMSTYNEGLARAAIALNNSAVSLLEKGHSTKALRVFKSLIMCLQNAKASITAKQLNELLRQAAVQVASAKKKKSSVFEVQTLDDDDDNAKYEASIYGASSCMGFPLRLGNLCGEDCTFVNFQYVTATVLYNFAVAYRCGFAATKRTNLLVGAAQTLRTAKFLLLGCADNTEELYELYRWECLLCLLHHSRAQVARDIRQLNDPTLPAMEPEEKEETSLVDADEACYIQAVYCQQTTFAAAA